MLEVTPRDRPALRLLRRGNGRQVGYRRGSADSDYSVKLILRELDGVDVPLSEAVTLGQERRFSRPCKVTITAGTDTAVTDLCDLFAVTAEAGLADVA